MSGREPEGGGSIPLGWPNCYRSVLLGEQAVSKAAGQGSNPCAPASPTWLDAERHRSCKPADTGANPVVGSPVPGVWRNSHTTLRRLRTRFDSWRGHFRAKPAAATDCRGLFRAPAVTIRARGVPANRTKPGSHHPRAADRSGCCCTTGSGCGARRGGSGWRRGGVCRGAESPDPNGG